MFLRKKSIYYSPNTLGAGTSETNKLVLSEYNFSADWLILVPKSQTAFLSDSSRARIVGINEDVILSTIHRGLWLSILMLISLIRSFDNFLVIANYCALPVRSRNKSVIVRHPYLLDNDHWEELKFGRRVKEKVRRAILRLTLMHIKKCFVQIATWKVVLSETYKYSGILDVLPNPLPSELSFRGRRFQERRNFYSIVYPSIYYEHKNFDFILAFLKHYQVELKALGVRITLYVNQDQFKLSNKELDDLLILKGRVSRETVLDDLKSCDLVFFPSLRETYGNGIYEGLALGKPLLIHDASYSLALKNIPGVERQKMFIDNRSEVYKSLRKLLETNQESSFKPMFVREWMSNLLNEDNE